MLGRVSAGAASVLGRVAVKPSILPTRTGLVAGVVSGVWGGRCLSASDMRWVSSESGAAPSITTVHTAGKLPPIPPTDPKTIPWSTLGFGYIPTKSMVACQYDPKTKSWESSVAVSPLQNREVGPFQDLYSHGLFEGMKATGIYNASGECIGARVFGMKFHWERLNAGLKAIGIPEIPFAQFEAAIKAAVIENKAYLPPKDYPDGAVYIRTDVWPTANHLGNNLNPDMAYELSVRTTPVRAYYEPKPEGGKVLALSAPRVVAWEDSVMVPGAPVAPGTFKNRANYGVPFKFMKEIKTRGYTDALFTFRNAEGQLLIGEASSSNALVLFKSRTTGEYLVIRPEAPGNLNGCTSTSLLELLNQEGIPAISAPLPLDVVLGKAPLKGMEEPLRQRLRDFSAEALANMEVQVIHLAGTAAGGRTKITRVDMSDGGESVVFPKVADADNPLLKVADRLEKIKAGLEPDTLGGRVEGLVLGIGNTEFFF